MSRIAGEKSTPLLVMVRDHAVACPRPHLQKLERNIFAESVAEFFRRIERIQLFLSNSANIQPPQIVPIDGGNGALRLTVDDLVHHRRTVRRQRQDRRAEENGDVHSLGKHSLQLDPQLLAHGTPSTITADHVIRFHRFALPGLYVSNIRDHIFAVLAVRLERSSVTNFDARQGAYVFVEYGIEVGFGNPQPSFRTVRRTRIWITIGRMIKTGDFISVYARDENVITRIRSRKTRLVSHSIR